MTYQNISEKISLLEQRLASEIGPRGGRIIGQTKSGKSIYEHDHPSHAKFNANEHMEASNAHEHEIHKIKKNPGLYGSNVFDQINHHKKMSQKHLENTGMFKSPTAPNVNKAAAIAERIEKRFAKQT